MTSKVDYDAETCIKNREPWAHKNGLVDVYMVILNKDGFADLSKKML